MFADMIGGMATGRKRGKGETFERLHPRLIAPDAPDFILAAGG